jgi:hypothetical protein
LCVSQRILSHWDAMKCESFMTVSPFGLKPTLKLKSRTKRNLPSLRE